MIQHLATENISCPSCGQEHPSELIGFPHRIDYNGIKIDSAEFYHSCPNNKVFIQTGKDVLETWKLERRLKLQATQQQSWTININHS